MDFIKKDRTTDCSELPVVKMVELPLKETISVEDINNYDEKKPASVAQSSESNEMILTLQNVQLNHDENVFCVVCVCKSCLDYREIVLQLINDHFKSRIMWVILQRTLKKFYQPIIDNAPKKVNDIYHRLLEDGKCCWLVNGIMNQAKLHHMDFISDLSPTDSMVFTLFSTLLSIDDPHQLFELMAYQVECLTKAYAEGLLEIVLSAPEGKLPSEDMIVYVLNGYETLCTVAQNMASFLFTFENSHLEQFSLSWVELNKRMYQKWVYSKFTDTMPKCIIELKDQVSSERYATLVREYIKFDDEMMLINKKWRSVWVILNKYHMTKKEQDRRQRIKIVIDTFEKIRNDTFISFNEFVDIPDWESCTNRELVWQNMVAYIKRRWIMDEKLRINATLSDDKCIKCKLPLEFHNITCRCITCLIAGGPSLPATKSDKEKHGLCSKCTFLDIMDKDNFVTKILSKCRNRDLNDMEFLKMHESEIKEMTFEDISALFGMDSNDKDKFGGYHLSWAVFKHLKGRQPYPHETIEEKYFCSNCENTACLLAKKILNNEINYHLTKHLINYYQPFSLAPEEMDEMLINIVLYISKLISMNLVVYDSPNDDIVVKTLWIFIISTIASYSAEDDLHQTKTETAQVQLNHLRIVNNDIVLPIEYLELNQKPNEFLGFIEKNKGMIQLDRKIAGKLQNLKKMLGSEEYQKAPIAEKVIEETPKTEDTSPLPPTINNPPESIKERQGENENNKQKLQCCLDNLEHSKEHFFSKVCFHEKECTHARINGTRDRLRKKLNQLTNSKKSKVINKNVGKSPSDTIKSLNKNSTDLSAFSKETARVQIKTTVNTETVDKLVPKNVQKHENKNKIEIKENYKSEENKCENLFTQNESLDEWVKDRLSYIEGNEPKKPACTMDNKKAAKKAKQKQKKEELKRIEELQDLKSQFHSLYCKEFISKNELKQQHAAKKKDKKKLLDLENNIKKLSRAKSKIERNILELISLVKSGNHEFRFSYLPTKEQQEEILGDIKETQKSQNVEKTLEKSPKITVAISGKPSIHTINLQNQISCTNGELEKIPLDSSKRMVTIRRVNLPHVSEPQVTVTAKGAFPGKDKLLYTFINGQLVPAASLDSQTLNVIQSNLFSDVNEIHISNKQNKEISAVDNQKESISKERNVVKLKGQLKRDRVKKIDAGNDNEIKNSEKEDVKQSCLNIQIKTKNSESEDVKACKGKLKAKMKSKEYESSVNSDSPEIRVENKTPSSGNKSKRSKNEKQLGECKTNKKNETKKKNDNLCEEVEKKHNLESVREPKNVKVIDKGQFDNNQFKMLHMDDLSKESEKVKIYESSKVENKKKNNKLKTKTEAKSEIHDNLLNQSEISNNVNLASNLREIEGEASTLKTSSSKNAKKNAKKLNKGTNQNTECVPDTENMIKSLNLTMQKLHLSEDTTIELAKDTSEKQSTVMNLNVSIMEQLNRGVQVENLTLPPGITLTKVDPKKAEALRAKRESIGKLSQPMEVPTSRNTIPIISPTMLSNFGRHEQNGVIMVNAMGPKSNMEEACKGKKSKNKRKNKKKKQEGNVIGDSKNDSTKNNESKMITLRNPMFHGPGVHSLPMSLPNRLPLAPLPMDQPADIIKNENGMFTIRNPVLHQTFSNSISNNNRQYNPNCYSNNENNRFSYFSDGGPYTPYNSNMYDGNKCISAIGSEVKSAQQHKQMINQWNNNQNLPQQNACDYLNILNSTSQEKFKHQVYNGQSCFGTFSSNRTSCGNTFEGNTHNCDDSPPPSLGGFNNYLDGITNNKYDDITFLKNLVPGQNLNSEVTIHNITESRFNCNQSSPISHGIEITPISSTTQSSKFKDHQSRIRDKYYANNVEGYNDDVYRSNRILNASEADSDERHINIFKGTNYATEENKKDLNILVGTKHISNIQSRPYVRDSLDTFVHSMDSLKLSSDSEAANFGNKETPRNVNNWW